MTPTRHQYWEQSLSAYFDRVAHEPFRWGSHDCCMFAAGAVEAMTGVDFAASFRETYTNKTGAAEALRLHGAGTLQRTLASFFGSPKHISQVKRGDVVMYDGALGICCGSFSRFVGSVDEAGQPVMADGTSKTGGLIPILTRTCAKAWTVAF